MTKLLLLHGLAIIEPCQLQFEEIQRHLALHLEPKLKSGQNDFIASISSKMRRLKDIRILADFSF